MYSRVGVPVERCALRIAGTCCALACAACAPVVVHNLDTGTTTTTASYIVEPVTIGSAPSPALRITIRDCNTYRLEPSGQSGSFRPALSVVDAAGATVFSNGSPFSQVIPAGAVVTDGSGSDPDLVIVPIGAHSPEFTVNVSCTTYPGFGSGPYVAWNFTACRTQKNACGPITTGTWHGP